MELGVLDLWHRATSLMSVYIEFAESYSGQSHGVGSAFKQCVAGDTWLSESKWTLARKRLNFQRIAEHPVYDPLTSPIRGQFNFTAS